MKVFIIIFCSALVLLTHVSVAQDSIPKTTKHKSQTTISGAFLFGGQMYNDTFLYNPGSKFSVSHSVIFSHHLNFGGGIAYMPLQNERFIPIYLTLTSFKKDKANSGFFNVQLGYSKGWNTQTSAFNNYKFKGGIYLSAGSGKKIAINNKLSLLVSWNYNHQFSTMSYTIKDNTTYSKVLNYDMFSVSTAFQF